MCEVKDNKDDALNIKADNYNKYARKANKTIQTLLKWPFAYWLRPKIIKIMIHKRYGRSSGFDLVDYQNPKNACHIDVVGCPYYNNCVKCDCAELCVVFCNSDDIAYGNMHKKLHWGRTKTLARGNECCNFIITITK